MALCTRIVRDTKPLQVRWTWFHVQSMQTAAALEDGSITPEQVQAGEPTPATSLSSKGRVTVTRESTFHDITGEVEDLVLLPGDVLEMWRD